MTESIRIEVVHATPERQYAARLVLPAAATIDDALDAVVRDGALAQVDLANATVGIWGRVVVDRRHVLRDGDRVEIYRPLAVDPKEARRKRSVGTAQRRGR